MLISKRLYVQKMFNKKIQIEIYLKSEQYLYDAVKLLLILCQVFGVAPINLNLTPIKSSSNQKVSKTYRMNIIMKYIAQCALIAFILIIMSTAMFFKHLEFDQTLPFLTRVLYLCGYFFYIFNSLFIFIGCQYQRKWYKFYFQKLIEIELKLQSFGHERSDFLNLKQFLNKMLSISFAFLTFTIVIDMLYNRFAVFEFMRSLSIYVIPNMIALLALIKYVFLLYALIDRYKILKEVLQSIQFEPSISVAVEAKHIWKKPSSKNIVEVNALKKYVYAEEYLLIALRKLHRDLHVLHENINDSFGVLIISIILSTFLIMCTQFYAFYTFTNVPDISEIDVYLIIYSSFWLVLHGGKVLVVLLFNHKINQEVSIL